jgi:hypothetical protein
MFPVPFLKVVLISFFKETVTGIGRLVLLKKSFLATKNTKKAQRTQS